MSKQFFVYIHCKPNGDPFYVGKGLWERANNMKPRNPYHKNVLLKYGTDNIHRYIFPCESEQDAFDQEIAAIVKFRAEGFDLTNMTRGGDGVVGRPQSLQERLKRGAAIKASIAKNGRAPNPPSQREAARRILTGNKYSVGRKFSAESLEKITNGMRGKKNALGSHKVTPNGRKRMSEVNLGTKRAAGHIPSNEIRAQWSEKRKTRAQTPEGKAHLARMTEAARLKTLGRKNPPLSEETRAKMSQSAKNRYARQRAERAEAQKFNGCIT